LAVNVIETRSQKRGRESENRENEMMEKEENAGASELYVDEEVVYEGNDDEDEDDELIFGAGE